ADRDYWLKKASAQGSPVSLSARQQKDSGSSHSFLRQSTYLPEVQAGSLQAIAAGSGAAWAHIMIASMAAYTSRLAAEENLVMGLTVAGRTSEAIQKIPSMRSNVIPLGLSVPGGMRFSEFFQHTAQETREALRHQRYRTEEIRRDLGLLARN